MITDRELDGAGSWAAIVTAFGTRPTMLACGLIVIGLCALALAAGDVRRLTAA